MAEIELSVLAREGSPGFVVISLLIRKQAIKREQNYQSWKNHPCRIINLIQY